MVTFPFHKIPTTEYNEGYGDSFPVDLESFSLRRCNCGSRNRGRDACRVIQSTKHLTSSTLSCNGINELAPSKFHEGRTLSSETRTFSPGSAIGPRTVESLSKLE